MQCEGGGRDISPFRIICTSMISPLALGVHIKLPGDRYHLGDVNLSGPYQTCCKGARVLDPQFTMYSKENHT